MSRDTSANRKDDDNIQHEAPPASEPEPATLDCLDHNTLDAETIDSRYPEFRGVTMGEFEGILLDEDDPRNAAAKRLSGEVMKPMNDMVSRTMASVMDGKLDSIMGPIRKQMSEIAASAIPKVDYGSILKGSGLDRTTQSFMKALGESASSNAMKASGFTPSTFAAAREAAGISEHLKSLSTVDMPKLSDSVKFPDISSAINYPDIASRIKIPKSLTAAEHYSNISSPESFRAPEVTPLRTRSDSVESWVESVQELVQKENHELTALESIASFLGKIDERDEAEAEQRRIDAEKSEKREKNMTRLTWASVIMVGLTLLITGFSVWLNMRTPSVSTEQPTSAVTSETTPLPEPAAEQPRTSEPPAEEPMQQP